jgi:hypothetical protein
MISPKEDLLLEEYIIINLIYRSYSHLEDDILYTK